MTCQHLGCGGLLAEDTEFREHMRRYDLPQRRFVCYIGHSVTLGIPPDLRKPSGQPAKLPGRGRQRYPERRTYTRTCAVCGNEFASTGS